MIEERRYSKRELARLYWPETKNIKSALKNLRQDIKGCPELVAALVCIGVRETSARCKETIRIADGTYLHDPRRRAPHSQSSFRRSIEVTNEIICIFLLVYLRVYNKFHIFAPQKHNI